LEQSSESSPLPNNRATTRRFPPPWVIDEHSECFIVRETRPGTRGFLPRRRAAPLLGTRRGLQSSSESHHRRPTRLPRPASAVRDLGTCQQRSAVQTPPTGSAALLLAILGASDDLLLRRRARGRPPGLDRRPHCEECQRVGSSPRPMRAARAASAPSRDRRRQRKGLCRRRQSHYRRHDPLAPCPNRKCRRAVRRGGGSAASDT
jgi:hypothetical protein